MIEYENLALVNKKLFNNYKKNFKNFLKNGSYILGSQVNNFEKEFANFCRTKFCVGVASGLDALILALDAFKFPKDTEIIVPANTYVFKIQIDFHVLIS